MSRPKVLFVSGEYPPMPGGVGDYTANLRMALAAMGVRSAVLASGRATGEDVWTVRRWAWSSIASVLRRARREQVDIVHIQYQTGAFDMHPALNVLPSIVARRLPVVTTFHDLRVPYLFPKAGRLRKSAIVRTARGSDAVIVTNPADGRALGNEGVAVTQIPIGPNLPPPGPVAVGDEQTVAFFGFPARSKGILDLVEALAQLPEPRPGLTLIGAQGEPGAGNDVVPAGEFDTLAARAGIAIQRTGYLTPAAASAALAQATVIALPFADGASLRSGSLLAALQSGRPVVTTAPRTASDLAELATMPQLLLVPRGDRIGLATAIARGLNWTGQPASLPASFRWQTIAEAHVALYRQLLDARR
ncbi:MAG TPA: glycosyltransferase [Thermomicrobiales bacterium]|nr:glycosyltransferase [Thermomicrobiales bacterium]